MHEKGVHSVQRILWYECLGLLNTQISLERKIMQMEKCVVLLQNLPLKIGLFV